MIRLLPTGWSKAITQGTPRMRDAVVTSSDKGPGIMSVVSSHEAIVKVVPSWSAYLETNVL